jgi:sugar (pentulose or hexulose) kinase
MSLYLGIDIGTSGCRSCIIDADATIRAAIAVPLPDPRREGPIVEQDPEHWWTALAENLDRLQARLPLDTVEAITVAGTSATLLLCDAGGTPLLPALMYSDARAVAAAQRVAAIAPRDCAAHGASASLAKLLWLHAHPAGGKARHALHQADWLLGRLSGRFGISDENNALKLGYDAVNRRWPDWLLRLDVPHTLLPAVVPAGQTIGRLDAEWRRRWNFPARTRVVSGTTDSTAGFIATGAGAGEAVTSLGSTLVLKVLSGQPVFSPEDGIYSHRLGDRWLVGGASNSGGAVLRHFFSREEIEHLSTLVRPERPTGLDYYPLLAPGERFPVNDPELAPRLHPRPADDALFFQGLLEGMARIEWRGYRRLAELCAPWPQHVLTIGGGAGNAAWQKIRAAQLGLPVTIARHQDACYGAALLALRSS